MKDEKLIDALNQFGQMVPEELLKKMLSDITPVEEVVVTPIPGLLYPTLTVLAANPKYVGVLIRKIAGFLHRVTGVDIDKIPFIDQATAKPSDFFFWYNRGLDKFRKKFPKLFKTFMLKTAAFDAAGYLAVLSGQDQKIINAIVESWELDVPLAGTDDETSYKDSLKQKQIGKSSDSPSDPSKLEKKKDVKPLGGGDKFFSSFQEQIERMQILAGINKKVI
tara:strand:- start:4 stop:666 length:663 start_codon:yes stop_codon:yes gene_type:complete